MGHLNQNGSSLLTFSALDSSGKKVDQIAGGHDRDRPLLVVYQGQIPEIAHHHAVERLGQ